MKTIFSQLRIHQWLKNLFIFVPAFVTGNLFIFNILYDAILSFIIFSITASSIYIINDLKDIEKDKLHPKKSKRPLASGKLSKQNAFFLLFSLILVNIVLNLFFYKILYIIIIYFSFNILYTFKLKDYILVDIFIISIGFILRVLAGAAGTDLEVSEWLISLTFFLSLLLILGKRFSEISLVKNNTRIVLQKYNLEFLKNSIIVVSALILNIYLIYTIGFGNFKGDMQLAFISNIPVVFALLRYLYLISVDSDSIEDPSILLLKDKFILFSVFTWAVIILFSFL